MSGVLVRSLPRATVAICNVEGCRFCVRGEQVTPTAVLGHVAATGHSVLSVVGSATEYVGQPAPARTR